jgi:hypothetical protein
MTGRTREELDGNASAGGWDAFLAKYDSSGTKQWTRLLGSSGDDGAYGIAVDGRGNTYIAGTTESYAGLDGNPSAGGPDVFLAKYDSSGIKQWTRLLGSSWNDLAYGVAVDRSGSIYIIGYTGGNLYGQANAGEGDAFLMKLDSSGTRQWTRLLGTPGEDHAYGVAVDGSGNIYITGYTEGSLDGNTNAGYRDAFLAKYDSSGTKQWTELLGTSGDDYANGVAVDASGNIYIAGHTGGNLDGNPSAGAADAFLAKYDSSGTKQWARLLGTSGDDEGYGVAVDGSGNIYIAGITNGNLDGNTNAGGYDTFWARYSPDGVKQ